jgi:type I restriction-modification system, S subunit
MYDRRDLPNSHYEKFTLTGEVKCIDNEIPFDLPKGWEWCRFGDVGDWGAGATPLRSNPEFFGGRIPWLKTGELNYDVIFETEEYITEKALQECSLRLCSQGDILIAMYGATIGKLGIAGIELTTNQACCACTPILFYNMFLFYYLTASKQVFIEQGEGGAQPNISRIKLVSHLFPMPPLAEQQRIVAKIEELMPLVEQYGKTQSELEALNSNIREQLKKSVLQYAIEGKLVPQCEEDGIAEDLLAEIQAEKQRLYAEGKIKKKDLDHSTIFRGEDNKYYEQIGSEIMGVSDEIPFVLPCSWQWVRFGQIVRMSIGKTPARGDVRYWSNVTRPWVSISDMVDYGHINNTKEKISNAASSLMGSISPVGSLLMTFKLTVGRTSILNIDAYHNEAIITIYPFIDDEFALRDYLFYTLPILSNMGDSKDAIKGKTLNSKSLNSLLIPLPPLKEQRHIIKRLEELYAYL